MERFQELQQAFEVLRDASQRKAYDSTEGAHSVIFGLSRFHRPFRGRGVCSCCVGNCYEGDRSRSTFPSRHVPPRPRLVPSLHGSVQLTLKLPCDPHVSNADDMLYDEARRSYRGVPLRRKVPIDAE